MNDWQAQAEERLRGILKELQTENINLKVQIKQLKEALQQIGHPAISHKIFEAK